MNGIERQRLRQELENLYFSESWWDKVAKMSDAQLYTVHRKFKNQGKIK